MKIRTVFLAASAAIASCVMFSLPVGAQKGAPGNGEWREYGGDLGGTKYSPLTQINPDNVGTLEIAWRWPSPDRAIQTSDPLMKSTRNEDTPLYANGTLYSVTPLGMVAAINPATGTSKWVYDPEVYKNGKPANSGFIHRGLAYWTDGKVERIFEGTNDAYLISIDAKTGKPDTTFGENGRVDLTTGIRDAIRTRNFMGRRPLIAGNVIVIGNSIMDPTAYKEMPPGDVKAFDIRTGKLVWTFHTVPHKGEYGYETWLENSADYSGNTNVWAGISYDPELNYVYLPVSGGTNDSYGGHRPGNTLFTESLVCLDAKNGKRVWHFQMVHHGLWDYDMPAQPVLGDITVDGKRIKAVIQLTKQGFTYAFDRKTGKPVWPIPEKAVPQSKVPRERTSPTQPHPSKPPAFEMQGTTEDNLIDFTPALRKQAIENLQFFEHGPVYTPPSEKGTLYLPGTFGGSNWGGGAFDPETQMLYVPSRMLPTVYRVGPADQKTSNFFYRSGGAPGGPNLNALQRIDGLLIFKPPYSRLSAIDMNKGEILWQSPIGNGPIHHPLLKGLNVGPMGDEIPRMGVMMTKSLVFVNAQRLESAGQSIPPPWVKYGDPDMMKKLLFVYDKKSGTLLREVLLDGESAAPPMTYMHQGKQYVVTAIGAGGTTEVVALALGGRAAN
ncbi:MAG: pyrroloquinoline quinone-dependent dehydrogenase [Vicinamibacterales bacterium]